MTHHFGELITGEVVIGRMSEALIMEHCLRQRAPDAPGLPWRARRLRWIPDATDTIQYMVPAQAWRPHYNGVTLAVMLPQVNRTGRLLAVFEEPNIARKIWGYSNDPERKQGSLIIQNVGGRWYIIARFRRKGGRKRRPGERQHGKHDFPPMSSAGSASLP